jgi:hypothetical protein
MFTTTFSASRRSMAQAPEITSNSLDNHLWSVYDIAPLREIFLTTLTSQSSLHDDDARPILTTC